MNSFKHIVLIALAIVLNHTVQAQIKLKLSLMADQRTYLVSMIPESTWEAPMNKVGSAQVVIRMESNRPFLAGNIQSLIPDVSWTDNAYVISPASAPGSSFVCFVLNEQGTGKIPFQAGVETPLFSFTNLEPGCVGQIELVENEHRLVQKIVHEDRLNITQNMVVLGARGNAFSGVTGSAADCAAVVQSANEIPIVSNLRAFPIPTTDVLQISWKNNTGNEIDKIMVSSLLGNPLMLEKVIPGPEEQQARLDVSALPTGLYTGSLVNTAGERQFFQFIVTKL